jgi:hypothetical protein
MLNNRDAKNSPDRPRPHRREEDVIVGKLEELGGGGGDTGLWLGGLRPRRRS